MPDGVDLIRAKRDGQPLAAGDIAWLIDAYTKGSVADEQMSAMAMAVFFRGLAPDELRAWTDAMVNSGRRLDLSAVPAPTVDKHSTGGVGDKVSLILAPLVAACGAAVPQLSGRGLGHTGGTLDKLESIPGWRAGLSADEFVEMLSTVGCVICAAGDDLAPADRKLYALRDVTGTVESIPLIASSIMSKKIAEGTRSLVLDVKVGRGAFMRDLDTARELAQTMVRLGTESGVRTVALLTAMDVPLGRAVGNAVEVQESIEALRSEGPKDLTEVTLALAREMLALAGLDASRGRPGAGAGRRAGPGHIQEDGRRAGRRSGRGAAGSAARSGRRGQRGRLAAGPRRARGRHRRVATWRRAGTQGGPGKCRSGHHLHGQAGRPGQGRPAAARAAGRRAGPVRAGQAGAGRGNRDRPGAAGARAGGDRAGRLNRGTDLSSKERSMAPTLEQIQRVPKVLLHDHLDGGLRPRTIVELAEQSGYTGLPTTTPTS